jgi:hypothetical protein
VARALLSPTGMKLFTALVFAFATAACTATDDNFYNDVPAEPALSPAEAAALPDADEVVHADELAATLAAETPSDDAAAYDDTEVAPTVEADVTDTPEPTPPAVAAPTYQAALLHWGLHPRASDALRAAGVSGSRIVQTIGNAPASAGTHARDGYVNGQPYSAATDLSVSGLSSSQIANLLEKLAKVGFAAWYRHTGYDGWPGVNHIHAVYANCAMKASLRSQVRSWLAGRNGLVSNAIYHFHTWSRAAKAAVKGKWEMSNEGTSNHGGGVSGRVNTTGTPLHVRASASTSAAIVGSVADGAYVAITCQKRGSSVTGTYGTTTLWDKIGGGYVSDAYVATGSDGQVAPTCP